MARLTLKPGSLNPRASEVATRKKRAKKQQAEIAPLNSSGEPTNRRYADPRELPQRDEISKQAFRFYEARGRQDGYDVEDWLHAEQELVRQ